MHEFTLSTPEENLALHNEGKSYKAYREAEQGVAHTDDLILRKKYADQALVFGLAAAHEKSLVSVVPILRSLSHLTVNEYPLGATPEEAESKAIEWEGVYEGIESQAAALQNLLPLFSIAHDIFGKNEFMAAYHGIVNALEAFYSRHENDRFAQIFRMRYGTIEQAKAAFAEYVDVHPLGSEDTDIHQYTTLTAMMMGRALEARQLKEFWSGFSTLRYLLGSGKVEKRFVVAEFRKNVSQVGKRWRKAEHQRSWAREYGERPGAFDLSPLEDLLTQEYVSFGPDLSLPIYE